MKCNQLIKEFQPVAILVAIIAFLDFADLGIVRAVADFWGGALGIHAGTVARAMPALLLEDSVCFAVMALVALLYSCVLPLGDALWRTLEAIRAIKLNPHVAYPVALALLAGAAWYARLHDTGTVRGAFILGTEGLKWLVVRINGILTVFGVPEPPPVPSHVPYHPDPFLSLPLDAWFLGLITAGIAFLYCDDLQGLWKQRKRAACVPLSPIQEL